MIALFDKCYIDMIGQGIKQQAISVAEQIFHQLSNFLFKQILPAS